MGWAFVYRQYARLEVRDYYIAAVKYAEDANCTICAREFVQPLD